jgi:hypothetical protein
MASELVQVVEGIKVHTIGDPLSICDVALFYQQAPQCELRGAGQCSNDDLSWGDNDPISALFCTAHFFSPAEQGSEFVPAG